jgi:hypothetical protein
MRLKFLLTIAAILSLPFAFTQCASTPDDDSAEDVDDIMVDVSDALPGLGPLPQVNEQGVEVDEAF